MRALIAMIAVFIFTGCAATNYQSLDSNGGYSETQLSENIFKVNFKGNESTSAEQASDFSLLRCADLTLANGYRFFQILSEQSQISSQSYAASPTTYTYSNGYSYTSGGFSGVLQSPLSNHTIKMTNTKGDYTYEAQYIINTIELKYSKGKVFKKIRSENK